ncbi:MAG: RNA repair transcriptional activator RtcR [Azonexus sp.]|nr:sigma 54-interacting transcriptional regulator [Betaproteobacteria bacterium]MBK8919352.1 sigma 54-interacting transcriptional regulator [Betaproteobacteria bacterium]MBP6035282.1 RNA repair transcriptional activator RtcR [Azonexus sp.]MBP6905865.1 RNA repair transcriptional activator RtcR [Azonexus sp.]
MKKTVVIGFLGTQLDYAGKGTARWDRWRPTVALCQQESLLVHRLEVIHDLRSRSLAERVGNDIARIAPETEFKRVEMELRDPWDFEEVYTALHDFARGYAFDPENEEYLIHITTGTHVAQICWFLLAEAHYLPARLLQTSPPRKKDVADSIGGYEIIDLDLSRYDRIAQRFARERDDSVSFLKSGIATRNPGFNRMIEQIEHVAGRSRAPMLLVGPTGAGKSFLARRVFELKRQRQALTGRFVEVNCATLRGDSAMSALFGHSKGAFTGAQQERPGLLRSADGGLLFLDEIGELGLDEQAMLLKAIEEKRFFPFGSDQEASSDFQLIAGTHRDLRQWVRQGRFRADLYARINLWTFDLPGLAGRPEDIEPNLDYELERFAADHGQRVRFNSEARRRYLAFATSAAARWHGNFRELGASLTRLATLAAAGRITEPDVADEIARLTATWAEEPSGDASAEILGADAEALDLFDRSQLNTVIAVCRASVSLSEAGRRLFAVSRAEKKQRNDADRLRKYLARFGLTFDTLRKPAASARQVPS